MTEKSVQSGYRWIVGFTILGFIGISTQFTYHGEMTGYGQGMLPEPDHTGIPLNPSKPAEQIENAPFQYIESEAPTTHTTSVPSWLKTINPPKDTSFQIDNFEQFCYFLVSRGLYQFKSSHHFFPRDMSKYGHGRLIDKIRLSFVRRAFYFKRKNQVQSLKEDHSHLIIGNDNFTIYKDVLNIYRLAIENITNAIPIQYSAYFGGKTIEIRTKLFNYTRTIPLTNGSSIKEFYLFNRLPTITFNSDLTSSLTTKHWLLNKKERGLKVESAKNKDQFRRTKLRLRTHW